MSHQTIMAMFAAVQILFAFAFGACIGSLINVLVYRMPRGMNVVTPSSRCPSCGHVLTWRENIPVFGWLFLRGRCRFCKASISPEYPIVEAIVGLVFVGLYVLWYVVPDYGGDWLGFDWSVIKPEWAENGFALTWPVFITLLVLVSSLIAMTIIDARTFTIPLALAWAPTVLALLAHPAWAAWVQVRHGVWRDVAAGDWWAIATPGPTGWPLLGAAIGGVLGLAISNGLLAAGLIKRSFADYDEWEAAELAKAGIAPEPEPPDERSRPTEPGQHPTEGSGLGPVAPDVVVTVGEEIAGDATPAPAPGPGVPWRTVWIVLGGVLVGGLIGGIGATAAGWSSAVGVLAGVLVAVPAVGPLIRVPGLKQGSRPGEAAAEGDGGTPAELWIQYPRARQEVVRELAFLFPCVALAVVGWFVGQRVGAPWRVDPMTLELLPARVIPLWLSVLGGVLLGYLVGGGLVWGIRIFGTLGFGKEAMGLGDVHLLAAVGACLGWIDSVLAFFAAPFIALYVVLVQAAWTGGGRKAMPYGPYLAVATVVVVVGKPAFEAALTAMFGSPAPLDFP